MKPEKPVIPVIACRRAWRTTIRFEQPFWRIPKAVQDERLN